MRRSLRNTKTKKSSRKAAKRIISFLSAVVIFITAYALVLPAVTMDMDTAAAEPGIEIAQAAAEPVAAEPVPAEPVQAEPIAAEPVPAEPAPEDSSVQPAEGTAMQTAEEAAAGIVDGSIPAASPDAAADSSQVPAASESAVSGSSDNMDAEHTGSGTAGENAADNTKDEDNNTEDQEEDKEEPQYESGPFIYNTDEYMVTVSFGADAQLPAGTMLSWREFAAGSNEYNVYYPIVSRKLAEEGVPAEYLDEAISAVRFFALNFTDANGAAIRPAAPVDVLVEYKTPTNLVENEKLYGVTFRADEGQPARATLLEWNARDNSACVEAAGGVIQKLRIEDLAANDPRTNMVIGQLAWQQTIEVQEEEPAEGVEEDPEDVPTEWIEEDPEETSAEWIEEDPEETSAEEAEESSELVTRSVPVSGAAYSLNVQYRSDAGIPEDAVFTAVPVTEEHTDYEEYKDRALSAVDGRTEGQPALLGLFDLSIYDGEGNSIQPSGLITVTVEFGAALTETEAEEMYAVHFVDSSADPEPGQIAAGEVAPAAEAPIEVLETESQSGEATFETESLSVYAVVYTVDFTYEDRTWSFPGQGSYRLADVLAMLGIEGSIDDAALTLIEGEDHAGALYLTQVDGEYYINSDVAFFDTYELRVTVGEKVYLILVTDLQYTTSLNDVLTDLTISGAEWDPDTQSYTVKPGKTYTVNMTFEEGEGAGQYQFSNTDWMTLTLPDGVTFGAVGNTFDIYVNEAGENYTIHGNQVLTDNGTIKIKLNDSDPNY